MSDSAPQLADAPGAIQITSNSTDDANAPDAHVVTLLQRPDWLPEKFYDPKTGQADLKKVVQSYSELERKNSGTPQGTPPAQTPPATTTPPTPTPKAEAIVVPGLTPEQTQSYSESLVKDGKLSDAQYAELASKGYTKPVVDAYVKGLTADAQSAEAVAQARIADEQTGQIIDSIGGKETLKSMQTWAVANLSPEDLKAYNDSVSSADVAKVRLAVSGLHSQFTRANGSEPRQFGGNKPGPQDFDVFESRHALTEAMNDPRYAKDEAYRKRVEAKLGRSAIL